VTSATRILDHLARRALETTELLGGILIREAFVSARRHALKTMTDDSFAACRQCRASRDDLGLSNTFFKRILTRNTGTQQGTTALEPRSYSGTVFRLYLSTLSDITPARPWQDCTTRELSTERRMSSFSSTTQGITTSADDERSSSVPTRHKVCSSPQASSEDTDQEDH
jgi:hypothetical protein